jgi:hypothetical protein
MSLTTRWLAAATAAALLLLAIPATGEELCLGPEAAELLMEQFEVAAKGKAEIDSMMVQKSSVEMVVIFAGTSYAYMGKHSETHQMSFTADKVVPPELDSLMTTFAASLPATIWSTCGGPTGEQNHEKPEVAAHDLSHLPAEACRPVPGHYCYDEYWTLPPRWTITGALIAYWIHALLFVGLFVAGVVWVVRLDGPRPVCTGRGNRCEHDVR